ncbi:MAG: hypothetical protein PW786_12815 [Arachidicoccus sp.]|nr:hypothetical protein [Arachidicoccus sp.]
MQKSDAETDTWVGHMQDARQLYGNKIPDSIKIANDDEKKKILDERDSLFLSYVRNNNNSFVSLWMLAYRFDVNGYSPIW